MAEGHCKVALEAVGGLKELAYKLALIEITNRLLNRKSILLSCGQSSINWYVYYFPAVRTYTLTALARGKSRASLKLARDIVT